MEVVATLVVALAVIGLIFGLVNVAYPIKAWRIQNRWWGAGIFGGSLLLILVFGPFLPEAPTKEIEALGVTMSTTTSVAQVSTIISSTTTSTSTTTTSTTPTTTSTTSTTIPATTSTSRPLTVGEQVEAAVREVVDEEHYISSVATEIDPNSYVVAVVFQAPDLLFTNLTALGICRDTSEIFRGVFDLRHEVEYTTIEVMFPFLDRFGNETLERVALVRLEDDVYDQINQDLDDATLNLDIIPGVAEWLFVHPAFADAGCFADIDT